MTLREFYSDARLDDAEREQWIALWQHENETCPHCGNLRSVCGDPEQAWYPQRTICYATAARLSAQRRYEALHKDSPASTDGDFIWAATTDLEPDGDDWLQEGADLPDDEAVTP